MDRSPSGDEDRSPVADARLGALAFSVFFVAFAGQAIRNLAGWPGFIVVALVMTAVVARVLWRHRRDIPLRLPLLLLPFVAVVAASVLTSSYRWATLLGTAAFGATTLAGFALAVVLPNRRILDALRRALVAILALSLAFELFVSVGLGSRLAPLTMPQRADYPGAFYWSENRLFELGPIQGIVGNRNLLAFIALLAVVVCVARLRDAVRPAGTAWVGLGLGVVTLTLTRSATVAVLLLALGAITAVLVVVRRSPASRRPGLYVAAAGAAVGAGTLLLGHAHAALALLGRDGTSDRTMIWRVVAGLAEQKPVTGWGWLGYWAPWVRPYEGLVSIDGVEYLQAHNALLDVWLQLGAVGVLAALLAAVPLVVLGWRRAVNAPGGPAAVGAGARILLLAALLGQSLTESRLLIEGNLLLFTVLATELAPAAALVRRVVFRRPQRTPQLSRARPAGPPPPR